MPSARVACSTLPPYPPLLQLNAMLEPSLDLYGATFDRVDGLLRELLAKSRLATP